MKDLAKTCKVAVVQASPVLFDKAATVEKTIRLIEDASKEDVDLILFPETFIPAYPRGFSYGYIIGSRSMAGREDYLRYYKESVLVPGDETRRIGEAAKAANAYVAIGVTERDEKTCTLYCSLLYFSREGELIGKHRKIKPTGSERLIWGDAHEDYLNVIDSEYGAIGGVICWENYMPLARAAMYQQGVTIYLAPTADNREEWQSTIKHIALEGRCYVLGCNQFVTKDMYTEDFNTNEALSEMAEPFCPGGSAIVDPYGKYVAGPLWGEEGILYASLDMDAIPMSRMDFDPMGHYSRPDVLKLTVNK